MNPRTFPTASYRDIFFIPLIVVAAVGVLIIVPRPPGVLAPVIAPDGIVISAAPEEEVADLPAISLDEIKYLQWCLVAAQSGVPLDQFPNARQREDVRFAREEMTEEERWAMYLTLKEMERLTPTMKFDLSAAENMV